ncbi:MAG: UDP-N-acetylglucosamine 2-epimerase (non-hydrolyzing) [Nitrososphaera sp.]
MNIICVVGARPNFMKMDPILREMSKYPELFSSTLVHTGQHYDVSMSDTFFRDLGLRQPEINLDVKSGTHAQQTAKVMVAFESVVTENKPDLVIVVGDVNSTLAATLTAAKLHISVAHIEAGLRSFDKSMPEEINRIITDHLSDYLFTPCVDANENLKREGIIDEKIHLVGNVMIDTLIRCLDSARRSRILEQLNLRKQNYGLITLHRPGNVDHQSVLRELISAFTKIQLEIPLVWPMHPRTSRNIKEFGFMRLMGQMRNLHLTPPLGYIDFVALESSAKLVLTDSGGVQEETTVLGVPCLTIRENTEWPITMHMGTNTLVGCSSDAIVNIAARILNGETKVGKAPELWDGHTAARIVQIIAESFCR